MSGDVVVGGGDSTHRPVSALGSWAFRNRSWIPVPLAVALLIIGWGRVESVWLLVAGAGLVATGQALRLWAVRHIGVVSRTRADRLGPLVTTGPYRRTRNPLYVGNWLLWTGFVLCSQLLWMLPLAWVVFAVQYGAMTRWEEQALERHFSDDYRSYARSVSRWWPGQASGAADVVALHPWPDVFFSERGTLVAVGVMSVALALKGVLT